MEACQFRLDNLIKPMGSLDALEEIAVKIAGITKNPRPSHLKKCLVLLACDHGIALENTGAYHSSAEFLALNIAKGTAAVNSFAKHADAGLVLADIGLLPDLPPTPQLLNIKIANGTKNITRTAAMTKEEALRAVKAGITLAEKELARGVKLIGLGAIGGGNTTIAAAIVAACGHFPVSDLIGSEAGLSEDVIRQERLIIEKALSVNNPDSQDALDILAKLGGFEIAGLVGIILAAAKGRAAVVIDGAATSAAALLAAKLAPLTKEFLIGSLTENDNRSCHKKALEVLNLRAYLDLNMHIGQGCGAILGMSLVKAAIHMLNDMKTFGEAGVAIAQDGPGSLRQKKHV